MLNEAQLDYEWRPECSQNTIMNHITWSRLSRAYRISLSYSAHVTQKNEIRVFYVLIVFAKEPHVYSLLFLFLLLTPAVRSVDLQVMHTCYKFMTGTAFRELTYIVDSTFGKHKRVTSVSCGKMISGNE